VYLAGLLSPKDRHRYGRASDVSHSRGGCASNSFKCNCDDVLATLPMGLLTVREISVTECCDRVWTLHLCQSTEERQRRNVVTGGYGTSVFGREEARVTGSELKQ